MAGVLAIWNAVWKNKRTARVKNRLRNKYKYAQVNHLELEFRDRNTS